jgi:DMSO/TMAO reductase YedYZ molybdopterin-dependent catalytic subunit
MPDDKPLEPNDAAPNQAGSNQEAPVSAGAPVSAVPREPVPADPVPAAVAPSDALPTLTASAEIVPPAAAHADSDVVVPPVAAPAESAPSEPKLIAVDPSPILVGDAEIKAAMRRLSRRSFTTGGVAALAGLAGWWWLNSRGPEDGKVVTDKTPWPFRKVLEMNGRLGEAIFSSNHLAPTFAESDAAEPRVNGLAGLRSKFDLKTWRLQVQDAGRTLPLEALRALPRVEMVTELKCIEGWSQVVHWAGARLSDFAAKYGLGGDYVSLVTPDKQYYVGLDAASALHPQTLLCYEMNGQPLTLNHGAPLRLVCTVKYGVKNLKRIGLIRFTHERPADYWAERGYDWHGGL